MLPPSSCAAKGLADDDAALIGSTGQIAVFFHVATIGQYQAVFDEMYDALHRSPVSGQIHHLMIGVVGDGNFVPPDDRAASATRRLSPDVAAFEFPTLAAMREHALARRSDRLLYLNCLGGRYEGEPSRIRAHWRRLLMVLLLERAPACLAALDTHDVCGVEWHRQPMPHMTSNNWWTTAAYVAGLPPLEVAVARVRATDLSPHGRDWSRDEIKHRHAAEFWLGMSGEVRACSLLPSAALGLPTDRHGIVPWWDLPGVPWERLARSGGESSRNPIVSRVLSPAARLRLELTWSWRQLRRRVVEVLDRPR